MPRFLFLVWLGLALLVGCVAGNASAHQGWHCEARTTDHGVTVVTTCTKEALAP